MAATDPVEEASYTSKAVYIETYGCQMNSSDTEVVLAILRKHGYSRTTVPAEAGLILLNTCAIRDRAEQKICGVDLVAGPDAYRDLPRLMAVLQQRQASDAASREGVMNVHLSAEETYADITPVRPVGEKSALVSVMRGCNNMCAFCIVPFTRGRERSRPLNSILNEVRMLSDQGFKEVTLLGQNVNSYADASQGEPAAAPGPAPGRSNPDAFSAYAQGFRSVYVPRRGGSVQFAELLDGVAGVNPEMRVRFTSPHPKDFSDDVLEVIAARPNVCKQLHMPAQSGSTSVLERMKRGYDRPSYDALVAHVRQKLPQVALSTDMIMGFCGETEAEHQCTLDLLERTAYEQAFLFAYSQRDRTTAARHLQDDVAPEVKDRRLAEAIQVFRRAQRRGTQAEIGALHLVLVEGVSRRHIGNAAVLNTAV
ncbi:hypothetical protein WJX73_007483 [Symbiochloris irregularis]|uniref:Uncharacterized protein n=1 Tax=Symbiochloris irregularis TaxID=706552 RepID=A0AAW1NXV7_9CHLO